jgi:hypothetical protein
VAVPEAGFALDGTRDYLAGLAGFASGRPDGVAAWIIRCAVAYVEGAREGLDAADLVASLS